MGDVAIMIPLGFFVMIILIVWIMQSNATRKRVEALQTLRAAMEKGLPISEELLESMSRSASPPYADLRRGVISLAIAGGFGVLALLVGRHEAEAVTPLLGIGSFPFLLGLAFIILHVFARGDARK